VTTAAFAFANVAGGLPHGGAAAAMRGCWCEECRRRLAELAGEPPAQLELPYGPSPVTGPWEGAAVPARRGVRLLPAGLVPVLPAGMDPMAGSQARQEVLAAAADPAAAVRVLVERGLAAPAPGGAR
jgi:hypothetical protein